MNCDRSNLPHPGWVGNFKPALSEEFHTGADNIAQSLPLFDSNLTAMPVDMGGFSTDKNIPHVGTFDLEWTSADDHTHRSFGLENCLGCKAYLGSNPSPSANSQLAVDVAD